MREALRKGTGFIAFGLKFVLYICLTAVFFISRDNYRKNVQQQLYQALEQGDYGISQPGVDSIPCFVA